VGQDIVLYLGAVALGALHAFEPGHGKTIIAAYMIGTRGRAIDGILLGFIVTFTHTFSVIVLGIIAKLLAQTYSEEQLHGWLGLFSALLILAVGLWMLRQRLSGRGHAHLHLFGKGHDHDHRHAHSHSHDHPHDSPKPVAKARPGTWNLLVLGISGGLVPCPAAIATLLAAIAAGRIAKGLTMAIFFSLGLGLVMMTIGVVLSQAGRLTRRFESHPDFSRRMGIVSAIIITMLGILTLFHSIRTLWF
jgi:nickel/cobalt exporter